VRIDERYWEAFTKADSAITRPIIPLLNGTDSLERIIPVGPITEAITFNKRKYNRVQLPLIAASAVTVHRAQGMGRPIVIIDASDNYNFARALMYVALSRCEAISGLYIVGEPLTRKHFSAKWRGEGEQILNEYERLRSFEGNSIRIALQHIHLSDPTFEWNAEIGDV
jgi:hypothetical protein